MYNYKKLLANVLVLSLLFATYVSLVVPMQVVKAANGPDLALNKPASASSAYSGGYGPDKAVDGNNSTFWSTRTADNVGEWWQVDLGEKSEIGKVEIMFRNVDGKFNNVPKTITFQVSDDGENWTDIISRTDNVPINDETPYSDQPYLYTLNAQGRYMRLLFEDGGQKNTETGGPMTSIALAEVKVYEKVASGSNLSLKKPATATSAYPGGYGPDKAVDGNNSTFWSTETADNIGEWWQVDLEEKSKIKTVEIVYRNVNGKFNNVPKTITFQVSDDGENWTDIISRTDYVPINNETPFSDEPYLYILNTEGRYLRLLFEDGGQKNTETGGPMTSIALAEVRVFEVEISSAKIMSFSFNGLDAHDKEEKVDAIGRIYDSNEYGTDKVIHVIVPYGVDLTSLAAIFAVTPGAEVKVEDVSQQSGVTTNDFTKPVIYTVTGENSLKTTYAVVVEELLYNPNTDWLKDSKYGVMFHYLYGMAGTGSGEYNPEEWNQIVDSFNVEKFVDQVVESGAGYVIFTLGQNSGYYCAPNAKFNEYTGLEPGERMSHRDLIMEMADALREKGKKLILYLPSHPAGNDRFEPWFEEGLGWRPRAGSHNPTTDDPSRWYDVIRYWSERYGDKLAGWWFDGVYWPQIHDFKAFADAAKAGNPNRIIAFNPGITIAKVSDYQDYTAGEINPPAKNSPSNRWHEGLQWHMLTYIGSTWGQAGASFTDEQLLSLVERVNAGGGVVTFDAKISYDGTIDEQHLNQLKLLNLITADVKLKVNDKYGLALSYNESADLTLEASADIDLDRAQVFFETDQPDYLSIQNNTITVIKRVTDSIQAKVWARVVLETGEEILTNRVVIYISRKNLALNKPATATSEHSKYPYCPAGNAVDGDSLTIWSTETADNIGEWWQVDMGRKSEIGTVEIMFRNVDGKFNNVPKTITFQMSDDGKNWTDIISRTDNVPINGETSYSDQPYSYTLNAQGRYLRLLFEDGGQKDTVTGGPMSSIALAEVRVYELEAEDEQLTEVTLSADKTTVRPGESISLTLTGVMSDGSEADLAKADIEYKSSHPQFANIESNGNLFIAEDVGDIREIEVWANVTLEGKVVQSNIVVINIEVSEPTVDKSRLNEVIEAAKALKASDYTKESWSILESNLIDALLVLENEDASQADVDEALEALMAAMDGLAEMTVEDPGEEDEDDDKPPKTGDEAIFLPYMILFVISGATLLYIFVRKKTKKPC
jgi:hypothetical protein